MWGTKHGKMDPSKQVLRAREGDWNAPKASVSSTRMQSKFGAHCGRATSTHCRSFDPRTEQCGQWQSLEGYHFDKNHESGVDSNICDVFLVRWSCSRCLLRSTVVNLLVAGSLFISLVILWARRTKYGEQWSTITSPRHTQNSWQIKILRLVVLCAIVLHFLFHATILRSVPFTVGTILVF